MAARKFTTHGIKHAALLVPASGGPGAPTEFDIKAIQFLQFSFETSDEEVWGDDSLLTVWVSALKGKLQMKTSFLDQAILEKITGNVVTTTGTGAAQVDKSYLGSEKLYSMSPVMLKFEMTTRDENEVARKTSVYFFSAQLSSDPTPDGMDSKGVSIFTWDFSLKPVATDEMGAPITPVNAIARLEVGPSA